MQKAVQHGVLQLGVIEVIAQPFGEREHPLPHRQARKDMIDEMRRRFGHAPGGAGGADAAALAGIGDDEIVAAVGAAGTGKAVGEDAAIEVAAEFAFGERWDRPTLLVIVQRQPSGEVHRNNRRRSNISPDFSTLSHHDPVQLIAELSPRCSTKGSKSRSL